MLDYSKRLIAAMGEELLNGWVEAVPNLKNHNPCRWCPYGAVCGKEYGEKDVELDRTSPQETLRQMEEALKEGGEHHG